MAEARAGSEWVPEARSEEQAPSEAVDSADNLVLAGDSVDAMMNGLFGGGSDAAISEPTGGIVDAVFGDAEVMVASSELPVSPAADEFSVPPEIGRAHV